MNRLLLTLFPLFTTIVLFVVMLYIPVNIFLVMSERFPVFLGWTSTKQQIECLVQGHNTVSLKLATFRSPALCSTNWAHTVIVVCSLFYVLWWPILQTMWTQILGAAWSGFILFFSMITSSLKCLRIYAANVISRWHSLTPPKIAG